MLEQPKSERGLLPDTGRTSGKTFPVTPGTRAAATTSRTEDSAHAQEWQLDGSGMANSRVRVAARVTAPVWSVGPEFHVL